MKTWTTQAEQRLMEYLRERVERERFEGDDAVELKDDLRRHIHEEAERGESDTIGLAQLENLLGRLDAGYRPVAVAADGPPVRGGRRVFWWWAFGVVMPALVLVFELVTGMCREMFFDPVPTWWHVACVAAVPAVNAWLLGGGGGRGDRWRGLAGGFAVVAAVFYGLLFVPLFPLAVPGVIFGLGLLAATPVVAALVTWRVSRRARGEALDGGQFGRYWRAGAWAAALVLIGLEGRAVWTRVNLRTATADTRDSAAAVERLRAFHSERTLLKACYEGDRGAVMGNDIAAWIVEGRGLPLMTFGAVDWRGGRSEASRDVFFRVTGKPFNSVAPPPRAIIQRRESRWNDVAFDAHVGGDAVAMRLKDLDLADSRFDGHVDGLSRIGYGEWTMVFRNDAGVAREARCQVRLPRDGRVSRLTLWVNDEPREAAFSTVAKVKAAYKAVAVVQRRDPVLVNMVGPDTVMVQCFPVPAHGRMKIRLGITAPWDGGHWDLPRIIERNFGMPDSLRHALWLQGNCDFQLAGETAVLAGGNRDGHVLTKSLDCLQMTGAGVSLRVTAPAGPAAPVWCEDRFAAPQERILIREAVSRQRAASSRRVVVIDGSLALAAAKDWLLQGLQPSADAGQSILMLADDHARRVTLDQLRAYAFSGGRDNAPALLEGLRLAREQACPVVWIHGPQAVTLAQSEALLQVLERGATQVVVHEIEAVPGPNRLAEAVFRTGALRRGPAMVNPAADLARFFADHALQGEEPGWTWRRAPSAEGLDGRQRVWDQLARLWAAGEVERPAAGIDEHSRAALAARYQLVTPVSGAVVLETQAQYDAHGLKPVDGDATPHVPNVPEVATTLMILLSAAAAACHRRRR